MKNTLTLLTIIVFFISTTAVQSQDSETLARTYFLKAQEAYGNANTTEAHNKLKEVIKLLGNTNAKIESLQVKIGMLEKDYQFARNHLNKYFELANKDHSDYLEMTEISVDIVDLEKDYYNKLIQAYENKNYKEDVNTLLILANLYLEKGDEEKYSSLITKAIKLNPKNATLHYNLGVIEDGNGNDEKAIKLDQNYASAYNNIAAIILKKENEIVEQMSQLGNSQADNDLFDVLKGKRQNIYREAKVYLIKALEAKPDDLGVAKTLYAIHNALGEESEASNLKKKYNL